MMKTLLLTVLISCGSFALHAQVNFTESNLPIILIDTDHEIVDEPKVMATMKIINNPSGNNQITDVPNDYNGYIGIEFRGQSSQSFDKKNFGIELWDEAGEDIKFPVLGLPEEEDWILHGPYSDKSLIRNYLTFNLWAKTGRYGSRTVLTEVVINGDYRGVYVLMEKIKRDGERVDISKLEEDENDGDDLTGGYIVKLDKINEGELVKSWESAYAPPLRQENFQIVNFLVDYPKPEDLTDAQFTYIKTYISAFEQALYTKDFSDETGYQNYIDVASFIDYALLCELNRNVDSYRLSTYLFKDKDSDDGKLTMGPPWDYNLAFGNADYCNGGTTTGWAWDFNEACPWDYWLNPFWWNFFLQDPEYVSLMKSRWTELRNGDWSDEAIASLIDNATRKLSGPAVRNFQRWPILGTYVWPNNYVGSSYGDELSYLNTWITNRLAWMDQAIADLEVQEIVLSEEINQELSVFPNPTANYWQIQQSDNQFTYTIYSLDGRIVEEAEDTNHNTAIGSTLKSGKYLLRITQNNKTASQLIIKN
ncbi:CotH kinase family protein [Marinoscillum pacificum]|uniref:CotH kinase family protein n=1 Tax=Marinoscillum pacificum TaxID=392723 RepID=UPI0021586D19|nr:CotH kinase family protein [Marinoscillum pacificum]